MWRSIFDLWFPKVCAGCDQVLMAHEKVLCLHCFDQLPFIPYQNDSFKEIKNHFYGRVPLKYANALLFYYKQGSITKEIIEKLKYKNQEEIGIYLAELTWEMYQKHPLFTEIDAIVAVPLHPSKQKKRGYNQVHSFCKTLSKLSGIPFLDRALIRTQKTKSQTQKTFFRRSETKGQRFVYIEDETKKMPHLLLVDDVMTTGSTLEQVGNAILNQSQHTLSVFCMSFTR